MVNYYGVSMVMFDISQSPAITSCEFDELSPTMTNHHQESPTVVIVIKLYPCFFFGRSRSLCLQQHTTTDDPSAEEAPGSPTCSVSLLGPLGRLRSTCEGRESQAG